LPQDNKMRQLLFVLSYLLACALGNFDESNCTVTGIIAMPSYSGVGHSMMGLVTALNVAHRLNTTLYQDSNFWVAQTIHHVSHGNYNWIHALLNVPILSVDHRDKISRKFLDLRVNSDIRKHYSATRWCGNTVGLNFGSRRACNGDYCCRIPGLYDRASDLLTTQIVHDNNKERNATHANVYWHLRTGDVQVPIKLTSLIALKRTIDGHIVKKIPSHVIFTQNATQALHTFKDQIINLSPDIQTSMLSEFEITDIHNMEDTILNLLQADVLVSLGSSGSYIVPLIKKYSRLVHFYFPPKESYLKITGAVRKDLTNERVISASEYYKGYFIRKGVIPVVGDSGTVFTEYSTKMKELLLIVDAGGEIPYNVSMLHYEKWLPWDFNTSTGLFHESSAGWGGP
jgi:hypothetical protein